MEEILKYFPALTDLQKAQLVQLKELYEYWNRQINVISRQDMEHFYQRHVLHALSIAKIISFLPGTRVLDVGTGGGFPGIPLAILFPETSFLLIDSIGKKLKVVQHIAEAAGLSNVQVKQTRVEALTEQFDFITGRAVKPLPIFSSWTKGKIKTNSKHNLKNGVIYLKGGDFQQELNRLEECYAITEIASLFSAPYFETKKIVHMYRLS